MIDNFFIQLDVDCQNQTEVLKKISNFAYMKGIIAKENEINLLYDAFKKREDESTTAFEDGFAIPHARIDAIKQPSIIISKFNKTNWLALDGSEIKITIALLIPKNKASDIHVDILSKIATLLLDKNFRDKLKQLDNELEIKQFITNKINNSNDDKDDKKVSIKSDINIVGVSACATGVAHTYMAKEALEKAGKNLGWNVKIETQGQKGIEFRVSDEEIEQATAVVFATDIYVDPERFLGKKFLKVNTNDAIHNPEQVLKKSLIAEVDKNGASRKSSTSRAQEFKNSKIKTFMGHLLSGVSRMIPFIVFSGILWAIFNSISQSNPALANNETFKIAKKITEIGFGVFIAMMGGFIAESITGRAGFAVGFISTFAAANSELYFWWNVGNLKGIPQIKDLFNGFSDAANFKPEDLGNVGLSLFAAIIMGFASGYLVKWVLSWKTHKLITPIMPIIFIPVVCTSVITFPFIFLLSGPLGYLMNGLVYGIASAGKIPFLNFFIGCLLGAMIGFDMGGPINKIAGTTATALIVVDPRLMGAVASAIPVAPLGCGFATLLGRKLFTNKERAEGFTALGLGFFGISEGAIPFAVARPKKVLICNVVGSAIAGGLSFLFFVGGYVGMWGGPITALVLGVKAPISELGLLGTEIPSIFGGGGSGMEFISILWFFLAIFGGSAIHATLFVFLMKLDKKENKSEYEQKIANFRSKFKFLKNHNIKRH